MKYGKLLQLLLEQMPVEYRDKFLSYKQLKKRINTILQENSLPTAAFVQLADDAVPEAGPSADRPSVESITARDVEVAWPLADGVERENKRVRGEAGLVVRTEAAAGEGEGGEGVDGHVGTKRKIGGREEGIVAGNNGNGNENVSALPIKRETLASRKGDPRGVGEEKDLTKDEEKFLHLLNVELEKFNSFFTEKEEDYVIRVQELKHRLERLRKRNGAEMHQGDWNEDFLTIRTGLVMLHGEVVLMKSYSTLNYTGLVKILKKHDKRTGTVLRLPFIRRVLLQPFFSTELLSELVKDCETLLSTFPPVPIEESIDVELFGMSGEAQSESKEGSYPTVHAAGGIFKSTVAALQTIQEMRKGSSTVSAQSLPPCNLNGNHERYGIVVNEGSWSRKLPDHSRKQEFESMACTS